MKKSFSKIASISMLGAMVVPTAMSAINADSVAKTSKTNSAIVEETSVNSVQTVRSEMQAEGLNLNNVQGKYIVHKGDTLLAISKAANESMNEIAQVNHITNLDTIYVGQVIYLGSNGAVKAQTANKNSAESNLPSANKLDSTTPAAMPTATSNNVLASQNPIYSGHTGSGTVAAQPSRTVEQARNAAQVATKAPVASKTTAKATDTKKASSAVKSSTTSSAKTTSSSAKASSAVSSSKATTASKSSVVSSSTANKPAQSSSSTASQTSSKPAASTSSSSQASSTASSSSKAPVTSSSTADKPAQSSSSTASQASSKPAASTSSSSQASSTAPSQSSSSQASSIDYNKGVVNSDGTVNYQAAVNQQGPWDNQSSTPGSASNKFYDSAAEQSWEENHPGAQMTNQTYSDGSNSRVPVYQGSNNLESNARPELSQQQLNDANTEMQKNVNASQTFGNGIQWVSSDYQGQVVGTRTVGTDNPVNTPYQNYGDHTGQIIANNVKNSWNNNTDTTYGGVHQTTPDGAHYVSSNMTNKPVSQQQAGQGSDGCNQTVATLTFYK